MIENKYLLDYDEIARLGTVSYLNAVEKTEELTEPERTRRQAELITEDLLDLLILAYRDGGLAVGYMLGFAPRLSPQAMEAAIYAEIAGETFPDRVRKHVEAGDPGLLANLFASENHRVFAKAGEDTAKQADRPVVKTWITMLDAEVRETHFYLEGVTVPVGEDFYTFDGDHAPHPGGFRRAENNVNCRCWLRYQYA